MTRSNRRFAVAGARKSRVRAVHARAEKCPAHGVRKRAMREPSRPQMSIQPHLSAAFAKRRAAT
eukprot:3111222-Lingulodinium_polyedra.AAC.1